MDDINTGAPDTVTVPFRVQPFFSRRLFVLLAAVCFGAFIGFLSDGRPDKAKDPGFLVFMAFYLGIIVLLMIGRRAWVRMKGGVPPLRFDAEGVEFPKNFNSRRIFKIPYADILSVSVYGKDKRTAIVVDTKRRAFVYPAREFALPDAVEKILEILKPRILAHSDGKSRWDDMEKRRAMAAEFSARKAWVARGLIYVLIAIYIVQAFYLKNDSLFGLLDIGANASFLVWDGEWFRLVTANLLHLSAMHILCNAMFGLIVGTLVERQIGSRRFALIVMVTGVLSQLTSALWAQFGPFGGAIYSVGISGALFGMLGAQLVLNRKFGNELPGGYRFARRAWWSIFLINFLIVPLIFWQVDTAAHIGGLVSGIFMGWLLTRNQTSIKQPPEWGAAESLALTGMSALWITAVIVMGMHAMNPATLSAEHTALIKHVAASTRSRPEIDNDLAWEIAVAPAPTPEQLQDAWTLASRAVEADKVAHESDGAAEDTLATIHYRKHEYGEAVALEEPVARNHRDKQARSQLVRFLNAYYKEHGARVLGDAQAMPQITFHGFQKSDTVSFDMLLPHPLPKGAVVYLLLHRGDKPLGLVQAMLEPVTEPTLYQDWNVRIPEEMLSAPGLQMELTLVQFEDAGCDCKDNSVRFFEYGKDIAALP